MSKRSFQEFSGPASDSSYHSILNHVDSLLEAAQSLKRDLEQLGKHSEAASNEKILSTLKRHNTEILPAAQALIHDETATISQVQKSSHKTQKVDHQKESVNGCPQSGLPMPHPALLTKWTPQDIPTTDVLPPLPPVMDPVLEKAARTHSGIANSLGEMDYEHLEWLGDAYLYLISSAFIYQTFPNLSAGRCAQLRERLVKNEALSEFTTWYGINRRARLPLEFSPEGRKSGGTSVSQKERKKVLGDLFEAYTAAAILGDADGLSRVTSWLKPIWGTILKREICDEYRDSIAPGQLTFARGNQQSESNTLVQPDSKTLNPKVILSQAIGTKGVNITYQDAGRPKKDKKTGLPWFTVGAYYDGLGEKNLLLGYGGGLSKKDAGANAAVKAMENKKLIKRLQKLKEDVNAALIRPEPT
ncbi:ribonuclease III [Xylariaceae sp. FL1651]|nr:ribonuclease III [Xylariaceae sp. FL1651]